MTKSLKDLHIVAYVAKGCHFCTKLKEMLKAHGDTVVYKDASDPRYREEMKEIRGFPTLISQTTKKKHVGCPPDVSTLIQKLS